MTAGSNLLPDNSETQIATTRKEIVMLRSS